MSIKSQGGVFGRNPTFNDVTVDGDLSIAGTLSVGGETITGLSYQGGWNASTNSPDIAASGPVTGQFWIVSADGSTDVGGITNWTQGDWALYDGTNWQRVEGGNTDLSTGVQGQLAIANGGTGAADASTARTNLGLGTAATTAVTDYATAAQGSLADSAIQAADLGTAAYTASTDYATAAQGSLADSAVQPAAIANMLETSDIGSTVQAYDADTAKLDAYQRWSATQVYGTLADGSEATYNGRIQLKDSPSSIEGYGGLEFKSSNYASGYGWKISSIDNAGVHLVIGTRANSAIWTEVARFNSSGNLAFPSGQGIDFSATSGTGTSELLDDYEEGTWTPTYTPASGAFSSVTYDNQHGYYTKVGNIINLRMYVRTDAVSVGTATGGLTITGLPYAAANSYNSIGIYSTGFGGDNPDTVQVLSSSLVLLYRIAANGGLSALQVADMGTGTNDNAIQLSITYQAA